MTDIAVGGVAAMALGALSVAIKMLLDLQHTSGRRFREEIARVEARCEADREEFRAAKAEWAIERAEMRARITQLEMFVSGVGGD